MLLKLNLETTAKYMRSSFFLLEIFDINKASEQVSYFPMAFTVGIAGITGKFARSVAHHLLKRTDVSLRGFCRDPSKLPNFLSPSTRIHITKGEFSDNAALRSFVKGSDVVICCYLGNNHLMTEGRKLLVDAYKEEKVDRYIASDYSLDYTKLEYGELFVKDPMKCVKEYIGTKGHVKGVHVLIGVFMETFFSPYFGVWDPKGTRFRFWGTGDETWESTSYGNAAEYVAMVALDKDAVGLQQCECKLS
jgi:hypothetical protein